MFTVTVCGVGEESATIQVKTPLTLVAEVPLQLTLLLVKVGDGPAPLPKELFGIPEEMDQVYVYGYNPPVTVIYAKPVPPA